jgi:catechol 2,3-dioxygenase-like lactoylglutathione lyase family enzyme
MSAVLGVSELEHVLVLCDELETTREFYEDAVGLRPGARPALEFPGYWMYAGETPCLHLADRGSYLAHARTLGLDVGERAGGPAGPGPVDHIAFSAGDYEQVCERLARAGVEPVRNEVPGGGPRQLFFDDPEGLRVEINVRTQTKRR